MKKWLILVGTACTAMAQDLEGPDFSRAIPAVPKAPVRWIAEYANSLPVSDGSRRVVRTTVDHTKSVTRVVEEKADGSSVERWFADGFEIRRVAGLDEPVVTPPENPPDSQTPDYVRVFFPRLSWIGEKTFQAKEKKFGREVYVFEAPYGSASTQRAYIAVDTLLPVALETSTLKIRHSFAEAEDITLPADFKAAWEKYRRQARAASKPVGSN
jgi:hypothetical protein